MSPDLLLGGGVIAIVTFVGVFWSKISPFLTRVFSFVIVPVEIYNTYLASALVKYFQDNCRRLPLGIKAWTSTYIFSRPDHKFKHVAIERFGSAARLYWKGAAPVWVARDRSDYGQDKKDRNCSWKG